MNGNSHLLLNLFHNDLTFILYFFFDSNPFTNPLGLATKAMEVALIVLLLMDRSKP